MSNQTESVVATINKTMQEGKMTQLAPNRVQLVEHARQKWHATPETGTPPDALLDPKFWAHYSVNSNIVIRPGHLIECYAEDGAYFMELLVRDTSRGGIRVVELRRVVFDKVEEVAESFEDHEIKWQGSKIKWAVIRKSDRKKLNDGFEEKDQATQWLRDHRKAFAA